MHMQSVSLRNIEIYKTASLPRDQAIPIPYSQLPLYKSTFKETQCASHRSSPLSSWGLQPLYRQSSESRTMVPGISQPETQSSPVKSLKIQHILLQQLAIQTSPAKALPASTPIRTSRRGSCALRGRIPVHKIETRFRSAMRCISGSRLLCATRHGVSLQAAQGRSAAKRDLATMCPERAYRYCGFLFRSAVVGRAQPHLSGV